MIVKPLTSVEVKNAKALRKDYSLHDGFGLLLYVSHAGGKSWRFRYAHPVTRRRQTYTIGRFPEFTLAEAREERSRLRRMVARGIDPNEAKKESETERKKNHALTFNVIATEWLKIRERDGAKPNTLVAHRSTINHLNHVVNGCPLHKITAAEIISSLRKYGSGPGTLTKMITTINTIMNYAVNTGVINNNPLAKIAKAFPANKSKPMSIFPKEEFPLFLSEWDKVETWEPLKLVLLFQIMTMVRPQEASGAKWNEIDMEGALWVIPEERMKGNRSHAVPLSYQAINLLKEAEKWRRSEYVFPSRKKEKIPVHRCSVPALISKMTFKDKVVPHGFRSLASTILNEEGFNPDVIEAALAHKSGDAIRNIYNRTDYMEKRRILMQWWGDFVDAARRGEILQTNGDKGLRLVV